MYRKVDLSFRLLWGLWAGLLVNAAFAQDADHFDLWELRVKGNTLLERKEIERTVYPFLGEDKNIDTVEKARAALEEVYQKQGFQTVSVDIPEQDVVGGVVYLEVTEGKVARLRVTDSRYFSLGAIKAKVPELAEGNVPNLPKMQEQLAELGKQSSDRTVVPILRAGDTPGTLEVDLKVRDELPLHGKVEVNGRNVANTSRLRTIGSIRYDNLWQKFHSASFMYQVSPEKPEEVEVMVGTYVMPLFDTENRLALYAVSSSSDSQIASAGALSVVGIGDIYGARLVMPLPGKDEYFHTLTAGVDYKSFQEDLNLIGADTLKTPITYLPFMVQYAGNLRSEESLLSFNVGLNFSIRGLGNDEQEFADKRFQAKPNYMIVNGGVDYSRNLPWGMQFMTRLSGQVSDSPIISNEQYSIGGDESVRGYFETQVLSDDGVQGSFELYTPRLLPMHEDWEWVNNLKGLVFFDAGRGWSKDVLAGTDSKFNLASGGFGFRFQAWKYLIANLDVAFPFIAAGTIESGDPRLHFRVAAEF
ncbi:MAG: peptidase S9 [Gammaproteobacteria bacterium HGW-Gammaproteobacteria-10]|nr:MAG: peptidase S9 [Gammaproteobacteria bacterium HGW-Gammaproteobacteria-10]